MQKSEIRAMDIKTEYLFQILCSVLFFCLFVKIYLLEGLPDSTYMPLE